MAALKIFTQFWTVRLLYFALCLSEMADHFYGYFFHEHVHFVHRLQVYGYFCKRVTVVIETVGNAQLTDRNIFADCVFFCSENLVIMREARMRDHDVMKS